ncbi:MAG: RNA polymerase subunit sigma, partial [Thermoanaerobaculia bacterium]|nr:RNA polymerase subunit sigma [Thermoanaerobaculia bacterium]
MAGDPRARVTEIIVAIDDGKEPTSAGSEDLLPLVYKELRRLAQRYLGDDRGQTLQATEVVHEAYLRLVNSPQELWRGKSHFYAAAARAMRHLLVDHARRKGRNKRGGQALRV